MCRFTPIEPLSCISASEFSPHLRLGLLRLLVVVLLCEALVAQKLGIHALGGHEAFLLLLVKSGVLVPLVSGVSHRVVCVASTSALA
jgi:hypothetical protein